MVEQQLLPRGIDDPATLEAMRSVPREAFIPSHLEDLAYDDGPLPIGAGQTISQPYIVAIMTQLAQLKPDDRVLEIGTGSGYQAAVLSTIVKEVYTVERFDELLDNANRAFDQLGYTNITSKIGDGSLGWPEHAPYDAILVTAGAPAAPQTLIDQLAPNGRLIIPIGPETLQSLVRITKTDPLKTEEFEPVRFVPLVGKEGY